MPVQLGQIPVGSDKCQSGSDLFGGSIFQLNPDRMFKYNRHIELGNAAWFDLPLHKLKNITALSFPQLARFNTLTVSTIPVCGLNLSR